MTKHDAVDPTRTSTSTGHGSEFLADVDESITEFAVQLGRERTSTHASRVRLRDADDPVEKARSEAGTRARAAGEKNIKGIMLESHLVAGNQKVVPSQPLTYGQSITDACMAWEDTAALLTELADSVKSRRTA